MRVEEVSEPEDLKIAMYETSISDLNLEDKNYRTISGILRNRGLAILYECCMRTLTTFQRGLYEKVLAKVPREIGLFSDPIVVSFALKDACDISGVDYVWFDLEGDDDVCCSAWVREEDGDAVVVLAARLLNRHLEKYLIDAYDRRTREDLVRVWEAGLGLQECHICGKSSSERRTITANNRKFRGWTCNGCGRHLIVPSDTLDYLNRKIEGSG
jgi:hypothetical protein